MTVTDHSTPRSADPAAAEVPLDGRAARGRRTREAVIDALLALQEEGDLAPTAARVAARAGVALRTVYGHFADMEALYSEAGRRELQKISGLADVPPADAPQPERIARFCASRARTNEALMPVMRATRLRLPNSPQLARNWARFVAVGDDEVREVFSAELGALPDADRQRLAAALYAASSAPAWEFLRLDLHLDVETAEAVVHDGVRALLCPVPTPGGAA